MKIRIAIFSLMLCLSGSGTLSAAIYKTVDEQGNVVFTDTPAADAKPLELGPASTYSPPEYSSVPASKTATEEPAAKPAFYSGLRVVAPEPESTIRENAGNIEVRVETEPELLEEAGHRVQFFLDGEPVGAPSSDLATSFSNVDRGEHRVEAAVIDVTGTELVRSPGVRFYLQRHSILNAPARPTPLPAR